MSKGNPEWEGRNGDGFRGDFLWFCVYMCVCVCVLFWLLAWVYIEWIGGRGGVLKGNKNRNERESCLKKILAWLIHELESGGKRERKWETTMQNDSQKDYDRSKFNLI